MPKLACIAVHVCGIKGSACVGFFAEGMPVRAKNMPGIAGKVAEFFEKIRIRPAA
jgi:hypothetical protein